MKIYDRMVNYFRLSILYIVFLVVALFIGGAFLHDINDVLLVAFVFIAPGLAVWAYESIRERRSASTTVGSERSNFGSHPEASARTKQYAKKSTRHQGWISLGERVVIHGREIGGMVYVGKPPPVDAYGFDEKCRAYIDPALPVARAGHDKQGMGMPYWPGYSIIPPECLATYLDWLAAGAKDGSYNPGYMFLYFYGLERRFFVDEPDLEEKRQILFEVKRLAELFFDNRSAQRYLAEFIGIALVSTSDVKDIEPIFDSQHWDVPFPVKLAIGAYIGKGENLSADWLLSWFLCHPEKNLRTSGKRCRDEFLALFRHRFHERFPQGLKVNKPRKPLKMSYQAASREFNASGSAELKGKPIPDVSGLRKPIEIAQEIADEVQDDLDKFSRYLGRNPDGRGSVEAHALLPAELRKMFPSKEMEEIKDWAFSIVENGGLVPIIDVIQRLEGERPEKLGKRRLTGVADALARVGFGLAPDPRFALSSPRLDEPVVLFDLGGQVEQLEKVSPTYKVALMELALASFIAHADGVMTARQRKYLDSQASSVEGLTEHEQRRLRANLAWFLAVPPDMALLRRKLKEADTDRQSAFRIALISAAYADGVVKSEEVSGIEKVYQALGLDPDLVYSDLHSGEVSDAPLRVRKALPSRPGEPIPEESAEEGQGLDAERIASIRKDTDRVSAVLADIFGSWPDESESGESAPASGQTSPGAHSARCNRVHPVYQGAAAQPAVAPGTPVQRVRSCKLQLGEVDDDVPRGLQGSGDGPSATSAGGPVLVPRDPQDRQLLVEVNDPGNLIHTEGFVQAPNVTPYTRGDG
jgi:tellurite resistance protein